MPACTLVGLAPSLQPCARTPATVRTRPATVCTQVGFIGLALNLVVHIGAPVSEAYTVGGVEWLTQGVGRLRIIPSLPIAPQSPHDPSSPHSPHLVRPLRIAQPPRLQRLRPAHLHDRTRPGVLRR